MCWHRGRSSGAEKKRRWYDASDLTRSVAAAGIGARHVGLRNLLVLPFRRPDIFPIERGYIFCNALVRYIAGRETIAKAPAVRAMCEGAALEGLSNRVLLLVVVPRIYWFLAAVRSLERYSLYAASDSSSTPLLIVLLLFANLILLAAVFFALASSSLLISRFVKGVVRMRSPTTRVRF